MRFLNKESIFSMLCETEILDEALTTDFTIGFELEGICTIGEKNYGDLPGYHSRGTPRGSVAELYDKLNDSFGFGKGVIESDSSVSPSSSKGGWSFEWASPKMPFNPKNVEKMYQFLKGLPELGVYTNDTCGFHVHMSYPDIDIVNARWLICCMALDEQLYSMMTKLNVNDEDTLRFNGYYASGDFFDEIKRYAINGDMRSLNRVLSGDKYRVARIHPQGTIEWRGPRAFLDSQNPEIIKKFILQLYKVVSMLGKYAEKKEITTSNGDTFKKEALQKLSDRSLEFNSPAELKNKDKYEKLKARLDDNKISFLDLPYETQMILINQSTDYSKQKWFNKMLLTSDSKTLSKLLKMPTDYFNIIITQIANATMGGNSFAMRVLELVKALLAKNPPIDITPKLNDEMKTEIAKTIFRHIFFFNVDESDVQAWKKMWDIFKPLEVINEKDIKSMFRESTNSSMNIAKILNNEITKSFFTPEWIDFMYNFLITNKNKSSLLKLKELPIKYQRKLVRQNPFNIQYIEHPDKAIVDWAISKEPEVKDYILGEINANHS